jgi:multiple sugar transport system substrate-binding protein
MKQTVTLNALARAGPAARPCRRAGRGAVLVHAGQAGRGKPGHARAGARGLPGGVDYQGMDNGSLAHPDPGRVAGRHRHDRRSRRSARRPLGARGQSGGPVVRSTRPGSASRCWSWARLGTGEQKYIPWMQATYLMAANRKALEHLPEGADLNALTYDQLIAWAAAVARGRGRAEVRLPGRAAGPEAPLLPGLPAAGLHELHRDRVPLRGAVPAGRRSSELWEHTTRPPPTTTSCRSRS